MSFLNSLLGRVKNTVNNDIVKPIQRDVVQPATTAARNTGGAIATRSSQIYDQANMLDNGRTYQQRKPVNTRSVIGQFTHNGTSNVAGGFAKGIAGMTGVPAIIDTTRLAAGELTHNQRAIDNATTNLARSLPQFLPIAAASGAKTALTPVAQAIAAPYANHVADQEAARVRHLFPQTGNKAYDASVEAYANAVKGDNLNSYLNRSGLDMNTSKADVAKRVAGQMYGGTAEAVLAGKMGIASTPAKVLAKIGVDKAAAGSAVKEGLKEWGPLGAISGAANTAANPDASNMDIIRAGVMGYGANAALPIALHSAGKTTQLVKDFGVPRPTSLSDAELAASQKVIKQQTGWGDQGITADDAGHFHNAQMKLGHEPGTPEAATAVQDALLQHQAYESAVAQRKQAVLDAKEGFANTNRLLKENQGGYIAGPKAMGFAGAKKNGRVFEGVDGKPRFEVSDESAKLTDIGKNGFQSANLSQVIDHPQLFSQYPELRQLRINMKPSLEGTRTNGGTTARGEVDLNPDLVTNPDKLKGTVLHEVQHIIQRNEGFSSGASPHQFKDEVLRELDSAGEPHTQGNINTLLMDKYSRSAGEAEARAVQARMNMKGGERYVAPDTSYRSTHQIKDSVSVADVKDLNALKDRVKQLDGYITNDAGRDFSKLEKMTKNPEADVKIYRASPKNELNGGDWVTTSKSYADYIKGQNGGKVYAHTVKAKDLHLPNDLETNPSLARFAAFQFKPKDSALRSTFYDSLDVPKDQLIVKTGDSGVVNGKAMSIDPTAAETPAMPTATQSRAVAPTTKLVVQPAVQDGSLADNTPIMTIPDNAPSSGTATRGFGATIGKDTSTLADVKQAVEGLSYKVRNTKDLQTRAATLIKENPELAIRVAQSDNTDIGVMLGNQLIPHLSRNGQPDLAIQIAKETAAKLTKAGQTAQAAAAYGKLAPEGVLRFAQSVVDEYNKAAELKPGKELVLTTEKAQSILKKSEALQQMPEGRAKDIATAEMLKEIKEIPPASWVAKLSSLHTIGQLFNPKTLIRNIGGNTMFSGLENASQVVATGVDKALSLGTKERTVSLPNLKTQTSGYVKGAKQQIEEIHKGVNLGPDTQFDLSQVPTFRRGALARVEKGLGYALRVPDKAAFQAAYDDTVKGLMKANKLDKPTQSILEQANATALYRTFQNDSNAAKLFSGLKRSLNFMGIEGKDGKRFGLGDLILKYPKTPGNILSAGIDYSPAGLVKGISQVAINASKGKAFDQAALANSIGRSTVGTAGLVGAGTVLGALGIITEKPSNDVDTRNLQKASGLGGYQINTSALKRFIASGFKKDAAKLQKGDTLVSYDWAQPASIPLSAGAAMGKKQSAKDGAISSITGLADGLNSLVEQPLVTGVATLAGNIKNKGLVGAGTETLKGGPASFVPTISNQARQLTDNTTRSTYAPDALSQTFNMAINKIPGLDRVLAPQVDSFGNDKKNYQNGSNNLFNVAINPAFVNKYQPSPNANLPLDIFNKTGETKQIPQTPKTTQKVDGKNVKLTSAQNEQYSRYVGTKANELYTNLSKDKDFLALSQTDQASRISSSLSDINEAAKIKILGGSSEKVSNNAQSIIDGNSPSYSTSATGSSSTKALYKSPDAEYKSIQDSYNKKAKAGWNSQAEKIKADKQLASAKVGSSFDKAIRDAHALSNADLYDLVHNDKNGNDIVKKVLAYDDALTNAGVQSKNKFRNKYGNVTIGSASVAKSSGGKGGSKATGSKEATQFAAALAKKNSAAKSSQDALLNLVKNAHVSAPRAAGSKATVANVTLKKQSVKQNKVKAIA